MVQQIGLNFRQSPYVFEALKAAIYQDEDFVARHPDEIVELNLPDGVYYMKVADAFELYEKLDKKDGVKDDLLDMKQYEYRVAGSVTGVPAFKFLSFTPSSEFRALECFFKDHKLYYSLDGRCNPSMMLHEDPDPASVKDVLLSVFYRGWRAEVLYASAQSFTRADETEFMFLYFYDFGCAYASGLFATTSSRDPDFYRVLGVTKPAIIVQNLSKHANEVKGEELPIYLMHEEVHFDLLKFFAAHNNAVIPTVDGIKTVEPRERARSQVMYLLQNARSPKTTFEEIAYFCENKTKNIEEFLQLMEESLVWGYVYELRPEDSRRILTRLGIGDLEEFWSYGMSQEPSSLVVKMAWYASIAQKIGIKYTDGVPIVNKYRQQMESWPQLKDNFEFLVSVYNQAFDMLPNDEEFIKFAKDKPAR